MGLCLRPADGHRSAAERQKGGRVRRKPYPGRKLLLGLNNYAYDWALPQQEGERAQTLTLPQALERAARYGARAVFDEQARAPFFEYTDESGRAHIVWFENEQSWRERAALVTEYGLAGVGVWNISQPFAG